MTLFIPVGDINTSENEEEKLSQEGPEQNGLSEPCVVLSPDRSKARPERQPRNRGVKSIPQARGSKKLTTIANPERPQAEEKPYKCIDCGKGFKGHSALCTHLQIHTGAKPFECTKCEKSFNRKANLMVHERIHTGERPYQCKECEKSFGCSSNLIAHRKTHLKKKPYTCVTCTKSFATSAALIQHQRVHVEGKLFQCTKCTKSFRLSSNFVKHQKVHAKDSPREHTTGNLCSGQMGGGKGNSIGSILNATQTHGPICYMWGSVGLSPQRNRWPHLLFRRS